MSVPFEIRYLPTAENDLDDIFDYIMMDNPSAAVSIKGPPIFMRV